MHHRYFLPPEWAPQHGVLLTWPHDRSDWGRLLAGVETVFIALAAQITRFENLVVVCRDADHQRHVTRRLTSANIDRSRLKTFIAPSNDCWVRDHGPITVLGADGLVLMDFVFNGWGGKFAAALDNNVTATIHAQGAFGSAALRHVDFVLEGGSIDVDGHGTLLTTRHCLLAPTRNPSCDIAAIESMLAETLGIERVLWLTEGHLAGDDTDSHIDILARFCDPDTIAYVACDDPADEHYEPLERMRHELQAFRTRTGAPYRLVPLPWPQPKYADDGRRLPAGYANFLIINNAVLVPTYDDPADQPALQRLRGCFPGRELVGVPSLPLIAQGGSLHCVTMQLPAGR